MANAATAPNRWRFSVDDYHRMGAAGIFRPGDRIELVDGEIVAMAPIGSPHAACVNRLNALFTRAVGSSAVVSVQNPLWVSEASELQPDLMILAPSADFYASRTPRARDVLL